MDRNNKKTNVITPNGLAAEEFFSLFVANQDVIYTYILKRAPVWNEADDLFQETAEVMWRKFNEFELGTDFVAWGVKIARYRILSFRKKQSQRGNKVQFNDKLLENIEDNSRFQNEYKDVRMQALQQCIGKLTDRDRHLIMMRYEHKTTTKMVAERVGVSVQRMYKILPKIQDTLLRCVRLTVATEEEL